MRQLTEHKVNGLNEALAITVMDEAGAGGAHHKYELELRVPFNSAVQPAPGAKRKWEIDFQNGPVAEAGLNGISNEALLAVVIDRLKSFDSGPYSTRENFQALASCEMALMWLHKRTRDRMARGVEGTSRQ